MFTESLAKIQVVSLQNNLMSVYIYRPTYYSFSDNILSQKTSIHFMIFKVNIRLTVF
jgi:hypothetical protein